MFYAVDVNNLRALGQKVLCHNLLINRTALLYMCFYFEYKFADHVAAICESDIYKILQRRKQVKT